MKFAVPLVGFLVLTTFLSMGLRLDPRHVPSPLINRQAPLFRLPLLRDPTKTFGPVDVQGTVWLLNVWASWCVSCRTEHPLLMAIARSRVAPVYGLAYRDERANAMGFLERFGDPYKLSVQDSDGRIGVDYGVYGAPETYVIDKNGVIRFKQVGPLTMDVMEETVLPLLARLSG